jgi:RecA-family ATPase
MAQDVPKPYWLVEDLLPEGFGVCSSAPKIGKSFLMRQVAYAIATGAPVLGQFEVNQGGVLYIDLEENLTFAQEGWSAIQRKFDTDKYGLPKDLHVTLDWPTFDNGGLEEIEKFLDINPGVRCVMIDVLSNLWPEAKRLGNIYHQEYKILKPLKDMAEDRHISFLVLHHDHKSESKDPLKKVSGSQAMTGVPDVIWQPFRKRGESVGRLDVNGRSVREHRVPLAWDNWNGGWVAMSNVEEMDY